MEPRIPLSHYDPERDLGHPLAEHLAAVSEMGRSFAARFPGPVWVSNAGRFHDLGKADPRWLDYLLGTASRIPHKEIGAKLVVLELGTAGIPVAYAIAGHHGGLPDWSVTESGRTPLMAIVPPNHERTEEARNARQTARAAVGECLKLSLPGELLTLDRNGATLPADPRFSIAFWIRMVFSALVDADFLDTEAFYSPARPGARQDGMATLAELKICFDKAMMAKATECRGDLALHALRQEVLAACRAAGRRMKPGFKSLNAPTGLGKTLAGFGFAFEHALNGETPMARIIYVAPYLSIIDQTAEVLRNIFGAEHVVEHHSGTDPDTEDARAKLAAENWDAPIIVTTAVQLFESLFANKPSRCRKLHRLSGAVVILDEAQALPPGCIAPAAHALEQLVRFYGATVVLATATQPGFGDAFPDMPQCEEILADRTIFQGLPRRAVITMPNGWRPTPWNEVAGWMEASDQVLAVVDSRAAARDLHMLLAERGVEGLYHLSTYQCPAHRRTIIAEVRERLAAGLPTRVVSTRLIEAGVDLDFPVVLRAIAGLDSIIQAAGRCNREGIQSAIGIVIVFVPEDHAPRGYLRQAAEAGRATLDAFPHDPLAEEAIAAFFQAVRWRLGPQAMDSDDVLALLGIDRRSLSSLVPVKSPKALHFQFAEASQRFKMIEDRETAVVVRYGAGIGIIAALQAGKPTRSLLRQAGQHAASLPRSVASRLLSSGAIAETPSGVLVQVALAAYDGQVGWTAI